MTTGWTITFTDAAGGSPQTVALEAFGAFDGGTVTGDGIRFSFRSHAASEVTITVPGNDPTAAPKIPFKSKVYIKDGTGTQRFVGRRVDWDVQADGRGRASTYRFADVWWELSKMNYKNVWWAGAYRPCTVSGGVLTFSVPQLGNASLSGSCVVYDSTGARVGILSLTWIDSTHATVTGTTTGTVASCSLLFTSSDVVLFQYLPGDPYQEASEVVDYYITTGDQIREIVAFAAANGVEIQAGTIDCDLFVPWYPMRCPTCADALKKCLASHPDCYTEVDYTTTPPTLNVLKRSSLTEALLPFQSEDADGNRQIATGVTPRPDLIPSRIGIYYRYQTNGVSIAFPQDVWPVGAPDGLLAMDYAIDLQGPQVLSQAAQVTSASFDPSNSTDGMIWWKRKCASLGAPDVSGLTMCDKDGNAGTASLTVKDSSGATIDYGSTYAWELTGGSICLWMSGISAIEATVTTYFKFNKVDSNGAVLQVVGPQAQTTRVRLVNTSSVLQTFTQFLTTGEAIPTGLAQGIYEALSELQYELSHKIKVELFAGEFIKPGRHCVNLSDGNADWETMRAAVQQTDYTLHAGLQGVFAIADVKCGPVDRLNAGDLVQLFNLFLNRDVVKIDPWSRITGLSSPSGTMEAPNDTPLENSHGGTPARTYHTYVAPTADGSGHKTVVQSDSRTSGIKVFKWDGTTLNSDSTPAMKSSRAWCSINQNDLENIDGLN